MVAAVGRIFLEDMFLIILVEAEAYGKAMHVNRVMRSIARKPI